MGTRNKSNKQRKHSRSFTKKSLILLMAAFFCTGLLACHKEGPMEKAGKNIDEATTNIGNKIEDKCEDAKDAAGAKDTRC